MAESRKSKFKRLLEKRAANKVPDHFLEDERKRNEELIKEYKVQADQDSAGDKLDGDVFSESDGEAEGKENQEETEKPGYSLKIRKVKSSKDKIANPPLAEQGVIPKLGTSTLINGTTGQGKSNLLTNLIRRPEFFGGNNPTTGESWFKYKFLCSPTAEGDDVQKKLGIAKEDTFTDLASAPEMLQVILDENKEKVKKQGSSEAPQILLVYDDVISNPRFMRTNQFIKSFIASRHYNMTVFVCSQSWTGVPRKCRLQTKNIFFFASPLSEVELLCAEHCPPNLNKKQFFKMVEYATKEPYSFLYINKSAPMNERYRKKLDEQINLDFFAKLDVTASMEELGGITHREEEPIDGSVQGRADKHQQLYNEQASTGAERTETLQDTGNTHPDKLRTSDSTGNNTSNNSSARERLLRILQRVNSRKRGSHQLISRIDPILGKRGTIPPRVGRLGRKRRKLDIQRAFR